MAAWIPGKNNSNKKSKTCKNPNAALKYSLIIIDAFISQLPVEQTNFQSTEFECKAYKLYWLSFIAVNSVSFYSDLNSTV